MSIDKKIKKYRGHQVNVDIDDGSSFQGILKGDSGVANTIPEVIYIAKDDISKPVTIPVKIITDISLI